MTFRGDMVASASNGSKLTRQELGSPNARVQGPLTAGRPDSCA